MACHVFQLGYSECDTVACVLDGVYGQGLIWLGLYFSPLLAAVGVVKLVIVFYFRYFLAQVSICVILDRLIENLVH